MPACLGVVARLLQKSERVWSQNQDVTMGGVFCTVADDDDTDYSPVSTTTSPFITNSTQQAEDERNASIITAGINQMRNVSSSSQQTNPHAYFSGDTFDSLTLDKRLGFFPAHTETVCYSSSVAKTNKRGKLQHRVWVLTDQAFYNFDTGNYSSCKRRIRLDQISTVFVNCAHDQLLIRVPTSYDYFCSADTTAVNAFCSILVNQAPKATPEGSCMYVHCQENDISNRVVTKGSGDATWRAKRGRVR